VERIYKSFPVDDVIFLKQQMLSWANRFNICCFFDNHEYQSNLHTFECVVAAGAISVFEPADNFFSSLSAFNSSANDWIFGHFNYDLKNLIDPHLFSQHYDGVCFPDSFLFVPEIVAKIAGSSLEIGVINNDPAIVYRQILNEQHIEGVVSAVEIKSRISRKDYIDTVRKLIAHLKRGDCYEINYCHEFFSHSSIDPLVVYKSLNEISPNPFSAFYKVDDKYLLSASPERYIKKSGNKIISQPIKGTAGRNLENITIDSNNKQQLRSSSKERSENVMVVDLVRNDLSKICVEGTVRVEELFGIYTFPHVHQMISTVSGILLDTVDLSEILKATFPMGSMTGAPKRKVMELIEKYEVTKRGIYSGAIGYISPGKDFDFSVVIRSIMYNKSHNYLSYQVGSAITYYSDPENEYEECLLKAKAMNRVLQKSKTDDSL
jgi:para-aminobenzoate synthetase component I